MVNEREPDFMRELSEDEDHLRTQLLNKYKRCLDTAGGCAFKSTICMLSRHHDRELFYNKWHKRWLVFADKYIAELKDSQRGCKFRV